MPMGHQPSDEFCHPHHPDHSPERREALWGWPEPNAAAQRVREPSQVPVGKHTSQEMEPQSL